MWNLRLACFPERERERENARDEDLRNGLRKKPYDRDVDRTRGVKLLYFSNQRRRERNERMIPSHFFKRSSVNGSKPCFRYR